MNRTFIATGLIAAVLALPVFGAEDEDADVPGAVAPTSASASAPASATARAGQAPVAALAATAAFDRAGPAVLYAGVANNAATTQVFRFANGGKSAGTVSAKLYDAAAGTSLGVWTSASIPAGAAIEVTAATIAAGATPALSAAQQAAALTVSVTATFRGTVQQLSKTAAALINQGSCGIGGGLAYVEGPGFSGASGAVRLVNAGSTAGTITLSLRNAATGTELGKYTSASLPAKGSVTLTTTALAAAASPAVPASTVALSIVPTAATARIGLEHLATVTGSTTVSNLTAGCGI